MELNEIEQLVSEAETGVERLRSLYDQYFMGIERIEPAVARKDIERRIQVLRRTQIRNTALRYRFQNILLRYNTFSAHWMRICREIEDGTYKNHLRKARERFDPRAQQKAAASKKEAAPAVFNLDESDTERPPPGSRQFGEEEDSDIDVSFEEDVDAPDVRAALRDYAIPRDVVGGIPAGRARPLQSAAAYTGPRTGYQAGPSREALERGTDPVPPPVSSTPPYAPRATAAPSPTRPSVLPPIPAGASSPRRSVPPPVPVRSPPGATSPTPRPNTRQPTAPPAPGRTIPPPLPRRKPSEPEATAGAAAAATAPAPRDTARTSPAPPRAPLQASKPSAHTPSALSDARVREIYAKYVESRRSLNESTAGITVESLGKSLRGSSAKLRTQHNATSVDFEVQVKNGKTVLKPIVK